MCAVVETMGETHKWVKHNQQTQPTDTTNKHNPPKKLEYLPLIRQDLLKWFVEEQFVTYKHAFQDPVVCVARQTCRQISN